MVVRRFVPSKGTKCHREITLEFLTPDKTHSPHSLLCPKWRASWFCIISMHWLGLVIVFSNKSFLFYYAALLTVHSFLTDGFIYSALEDSEIMGHIDTAINCSWYISTYISMYAWSCPFTGGYLQELLRLLTDIDYMQTNVFVKLTLSCNHIKKLRPDKIWRLSMLGATEKNYDLKLNINQWKIQASFRKIVISR